MDIVAVITAAAVIGVTGLLIGLLLGVAGIKFAVEVDEKELFVRELLPGNNCGGCGFAGCDALAKAIAAGDAPVNSCPVAGPDKAVEIGKVMGVDSSDAEKMVAFVKCAGTCDKAGIKYNYYGIHDCKKLALIPGNGEKKCSYGCMGYGTCVRACPFDAIEVVNGVAVVDKDKCKACGKCIAVCPNQLIELVPYSATHIVQCNSKDKGKIVREVCKAGCIGCGICVKQCEAGAVTLENNLAHIDQSKCTGCGKCAEKCPAKVII
ncbi:RnfABCDGE type electron transport complex subunit B [Anaeromicropila populeti]|uniref:Ion-translocating oxidoreductase complex subunit B n=1 Tax=Anaeromicropila populeti TaxID=37658 RepID=A0A1I6I9J4_9FIRM|nr:RnfABCDGE type electron transport complex subunit B [Anaeromicropila populeti]SFR63435.1 electron transport complex, RnfABCDGE type, B subunit [Anaeromicropila populeti]